MLRLLFATLLVLVSTSATTSARAQLVGFARDASPFDLSGPQTLEFVTLFGVHRVTWTFTLEHDLRGRLRGAGTGSEAGCVIRGRIGSSRDGPTLRLVGRCPDGRRFRITSRPPSINRSSGSSVLIQPGSTPRVLRNEAWSLSGFSRFDRTGFEVQLGVSAQIDSRTGVGPFGALPLHAVTKRGDRLLARSVPRGSWLRMDAPRRLARRGDWVLYEADVRWRIKGQRGSGIVHLLEGASGPSPVASISRYRGFHAVREVSGWFGARAHLALPDGNPVAEGNIGYVNLAHLRVTDPAQVDLLLAGGTAEVPGELVRAEVTRVRFIFGIAFDPLPHETVHVALTAETREALNDAPPFASGAAQFYDECVRALAAADSPEPLVVLRLYADLDGIFLDPNVSELCYAGDDAFPLAPVDPNE